jgi:hypothetical protein
MVEMSNVSHVFSIIMFIRVFIQYLCPAEVYKHFNSGRYWFLITIPFNISYPVHPHMVISKYWMSCVLCAIYSDASATRNCGMICNKNSPIQKKLG